MCVQDVLNDLQWWGLVFRDKLSEDLRAQGKKDQRGEMVEWYVQRRQVFCVRYDTAIASRRKGNEPEVTIKFQEITK